MNVTLTFTIKGQNRCIYEWANKKDDVQMEKVIKCFPLYNFFVKILCPS